jgi:predicted nucleic acid-binding protein
VNRFVVFDTSVYIALLRDPAFASELRPRYARDVPRIRFSSVVVQELLAGARTFRQRRQVAELWAPFERTRRIVTPTHGVWREAGEILAKIAVMTPGLRSKLSRGFVNDVLIALSARSIGAAVVTRNAEDFRLIRRLKAFSLEIV